MIKIEKLIHNKDEKLEERINPLRRNFYDKYGISVEFFVRAPGRVNLIGEHIDYCGYSVAPMAIEQDIIAAVGNYPHGSGKLCLTNLNSQFPDYECDINNFSLSGDDPEWYKYVLCAIKGIREDAYAGKELPGFCMSIHGNIPPAAGLSSSSALVCLSALTLVHILELPLNAMDLATLCARAERHIGTQGGGMDQAASLLSNKGRAQLIEFNPLRVIPMSLPSSARFVCANSLIKMNKAATSHFNCRVVECRLAAQVIAKAQGLSLKPGLQLRSLQDILKKSLSDMLEMVNLCLHESPYTKGEVASQLGMEECVLEQTHLSRNTWDLQSFELHKRAKHVFSEALRVTLFKQECDAWEGQQDNQTTVLQNLGNMMNESHESTKNLYECSHPKLDVLVDLCKPYAMGARLTGAGWGGCIVALVHENNEEKLLKHLKEKFYIGCDSDEVNGALFSSQPAAGAALYV